MSVSDNTFKEITYNGISLIQNVETEYINISKAFRDNNKQWAKYKQTKNWKEIEKVAENHIKSGNWKVGEKSHPPIYDVYFDVNTGPNEFRGIYIHPKLIHFVCQYVSVEYAFKVAELMDSINEKVHEELAKSNLPDTPENAKPIFNQTVQNIRSSNVSELENQQCWGIRERNKYDYLDSYDKSDIRNLWLKIKEFGKNIMNDYPELFQ